MKMPSLPQSVYRRVCLGRVKKMVIIVLVFLFAFLSTIFVIPIRNVVFYEALEYAWLDIPTIKLLSIRYSTDAIPNGLHCTVTCYEHTKPKFSISDLDVSAMLTYPNLENDGLKLEVMRRRHGNFLPTLSTIQKRDTLSVYSVLADAFDAQDVKYFLVAGTLLGLVRHSGMIPWDDDIDIAVSITQWELVKQALACVNGFTLTIFYNFHWKFHYTGSDYPFIDIFFYQMDDSYAWSLTPYIRRTFIYPTKYVFPLTLGIFEGLIVPIPKDSLRIVRQIYDYDTCCAYQNHVDYKNYTLMKEHPLGFSVESVNCRELAYIYNMSNLGV